MAEAHRPVYVVPDTVGRPSRARAVGRRRYVFPFVAAAVLGTFLVAPWPFAHKAHLALHGLCAQRPSHTLLLGGEPLPFDARMTGIYGGFLVTTVYFALRGRLQAFRLPPRRVLALLACFVVAMAIDGMNSLLLDLGLRHAYEPDNRFRVATGLLTGIALATILCVVLATTLWRVGEWGRSPIGGLRELSLVTALQMPFGVAVFSGAGVLFVPFAMALIVSAVAVVGTLALVVLVLLAGRERGYRSVGEVQVHLTGALLLAVVVMAAFAGGRALLERLTNAPPLT